MCPSSLQVDTIASVHIASMTSNYTSVQTATAGRLLSFGTCRSLPLIERVFHFTQELRRKEGLSQDCCAMLGQFAQLGKLVTEARYKQELGLGASRTNSL